MNLHKRFYDHKYSAALRGIKFLFTFDEWLQVWIDSGHLNEKGRGANAYCMARNGDKGPYKLGNVRIITNRENRAEQKLSKKTRLKMRLAKLGRKLSKEHRAKIAASNTGKKMSAAARENGRLAKLGELNPCAKLTEAKVLFIRKSPLPHVILAERFSVSPSLILMVRNRQRWGHI
jgi:hypothetical protein